jgi:hypothetical protein
LCNVLAPIEIKIINSTRDTINGGVMIFNKTPIETPNTRAGMSTAAKEYSINGFEYIEGCRRRIEYIVAPRVPVAISA